MSKALRLVDDLLSMTAQVQIPKELEDVVGKKVQCEEWQGYVRYVGPVATSKKATTIWLGVEWDDDRRGKHDGSITADDGTTIRYFKCEAGKGSFIKPVKANFGRDLVTVLKDRFSLQNLDNDLEEQEAISADSGYKVQFVGWAKSMERQCDLSNKSIVPLDRSDVAYIDMEKLDLLSDTIPKTISIDLRFNFLASWSTLSGLKALPRLKELLLSHNELSGAFFIGKDAKSRFQSFGSAFANVERLIVNHIVAHSDLEKSYNMPWFIIYNLAANGCLPKLRELEFCDNQIKHFSLPSLESVSAAESECKLAELDSGDVAKHFPNLIKLNIGSNVIDDWECVANTFGKLPKLQKLTLSYNPLKSIAYKPQLFDELRAILIRNGAVDNVTIFDEVNRFPKIVESLFVDNPISKEIGDNTLRDLAIAKIEKLKVCNSSEVSDKERYDAELFYLKWIANQLQKSKKAAAANSSGGSGSGSEEKKSDEASSTDDDDAIDKLYPRYKALVEKHGAHKNTEKKSAAITTVSVTLKSMDPESITAKAVSKKLPLSITVAQLKMLCKRLFKLAPQHQRLMLRGMGQAFPSDMLDESKPLSFYGVKDGATILMQSSDFGDKYSDKK